MVRLWFLFKLIICSTGLMIFLKCWTLFNNNRTTRIFNHSIVREKTIEKLINKYKVDYNYTMREDPWIVAQRWVTGRHIHPEYTPSLGGVLRCLVTKKITHADILLRGSHVKMLLTLEGGQKAVFRPKVVDVDYVPDDLTETWNRHNTEIAAYHIGRLLEFRRAPHMIGRYVNMETEIMPVAAKNLTRYIKQEGNTYQIKHYREKGNSKGQELMMNSTGALFEGSMALWVPNQLKFKIHPWRIDSYETVMQLEKDESMCKLSTFTKNDKVKGVLLLDIIDTDIFDLLIGKKDRPDLYLLTMANESQVVMVDNANGFNQPWLVEEHLPVVSALQTCCRIRESTWSRMLYLDDILGDVLKHVIAQDPIAPVLTQDHLDGLNKRLKIAINSVEKCIASFGKETVLVTDK